MNVLSLFDGISCGQIALERAGIKVDNYYASEIDKYAIKVTQHNYPNTIQLGDVKKVNIINLPKIDLLMAGSPCQGFSKAGNGLNFEHKESKLFFEFVRIFKECNPKYFLLENVEMKKEWEVIINKILGCRPIKLNSTLVSAQTRQRFYWTNIPVNTIPQNKNIVLNDILESGIPMVDKSYGIDSNYFKGGKKTVNPINQSQRRNMVFQINPSKESGGKQPFQQNRVYNTNGKIPALCSQLSGGSSKILIHNLQPRNGKGSGGKGHLMRQNGKLYCIDTNNGQEIELEGQVRKLTVKECCRAQTIPDNYVDGIISNSQAYKTIGNGWTVDIIVHILKHVKVW
jgi:DNA-cytosine methyltransferase